NNIPDNHMLQAYFNKRVLKILTKYNKKMIGWDEIFQPGLPNNIVIHSWRGQKSLIESAQKGYMGILSNGYYIDLIQPAEYHYLNDPIPAGTPLSAEEQKQILGGEATSWAELVTNETIDSRIWPRTAAIAERFWSPQSVKNVDDMYRRLEITSFHLEELGLLHRKNYEMMLRRLTNDKDITALKTFVDVVEPVKIYTRHRQGKIYLQQSPYTRVVDAARPESMTARHFSKLVDQYIADPKNPDAAELILQLSVWQENHRQLMEIIKVSPVLKEIESMSADLDALANLGLEAAKALAKNKKLKKNVVDASVALFEKAAKPRGQVELMIVPSIRKLVAAASN
ncbi:MAG: family 20 glycosylhydrolase, partial [Candidatus Marinimicrobia bacterium]|nr:family 20 glycosylhydrolase [Candidatus Neomarinimicrobiota bacterium]